jgi:hypothetical protein
MNQKSFYRYWIGKDVDYLNAWENFEQGDGYVQKYRDSEVYLLKVKFNRYEANSPIFNFEAIYKTFKWLYHELKLVNFPKEEYDRLGPLYIYEVTRGSEEWQFLGEFLPLLLFWNMLNQYKESRLVNKQIDKVDWEIAKLKDDILAKHPKASIHDVNALIEAKSTEEIDEALKILNAQNLETAKISRHPFNGSKDIDFE